MLIIWKAELIIQKVELTIKNLTGSQTYRGNIAGWRLILFPCRGIELTVEPANNINSRKKGVFSFACDLDLFVLLKVPIRLMFVIRLKMRGTCRTCIVIEARAWITLSTMRVSKTRDVSALPH